MLRREDRATNSAAIAPMNGTVGVQASTASTSATIALVSVLGAGVP